MAIITISRGTYSGGKAVAEKLAARFGYPCVSREIVFEATETSGVPEEQLRALLEKPPRFWQQKPGRLVSHINYVRAALLKRANKGNLVYHGYAGHLLLSGVAHVLRVRVIAGMEQRIRSAMERHGVTRENAKRGIKNLDEQRTSWTRILYGVTWQDPLLYDAVLNLDRLGIDGAVETIAHMSEQPDFQPSAESQQALDDLLLGSLVWAELTKNPRTQSANLRVVADKGEALVTGHADSDAVLEAIAAVAAAVPGVRALVVNVGIGSHWHW